jgi:hypothetical protein
VARGGGTRCKARGARGARGARRWHEVQSAAPIARRRNGVPSTFAASTPGALACCFSLSACPAGAGRARARARAGAAGASPPPGPHTHTTTPPARRTPSPTAGMDGRWLDKSSKTGLQRTLLQRHPDTTPDRNPHSQHARFFFPAGWPAPSAPAERLRATTMRPKRDATHSENAHNTPNRRPRGPKSGPPALLGAAAPQLLACRPMAAAPVLCGTPAGGAAGQRQQRAGRQRRRRACPGQHPCPPPGAVKGAARPQPRHPP